MSIHNPVRLPDETLDEYRARQLASKRAAQAMTLAGLQNRRQQPSLRQSLRDSQRAAGRGPKGTYVFGIGNAAAKRRADKLDRSYPLRDKYGAFTLAGRGKPEPSGSRPRRMWLAGISAQRGY